MAKAYRPRNEIEKAFLKAFDSLCYRHNPWTVWTDFINMYASSISNAVDHEQDRWRAREASYLATAKRYTPEELNLFAELAGLTVSALEAAPAQDFLGNLYMNLNFGSDWSGQFFTPWHVAEMMARMQMGPGLAEQVEREGYISINDPCCGAGCMLLAFAYACRTDPNGPNYQTQVVFVAQDIDRVVAQMCYIQLSLLGCPGYVIVGNTLTKPPTGSVLRPCVPKGTEMWFTPMWFTDVWTIRIIGDRLRELFG